MPVIIPIGTFDPTTLAAAGRYEVGRSAFAYGGLEVDVVPSERHALRKDVTEHPAETAEAFTDGVIRKQDEITLECLVSDEGGADPHPGRALEIWQALDTIFNTNVLADLTTSLKVYRNVLLMALDVPRDAATAHALRFTATFRTARLATFETVRIRPGTAVRNQVPKKKDKGPVAPVSVDNRTWAATIEDTLFGVGVGL